MTYQDQDPSGGRGAVPIEPRRPAAPSQRATPRQALWSCAVAAAVVFVLGVVFYRINAADHPQTATAPATTSASTAGNAAGANTPGAPQTTGRGGSQDEPADKGAH